MRRRLKPRRRYAALPPGRAQRGGPGLERGAAAACSAPRGGTQAGSGADGGGRTATPATISYLSFFGPDDPQTISFPHVLQQFQQRHPNVTVEQTSTSGTSSNVMEKYLTLISAGTPPDVAAVNPQFIEPLWSKGALADLTAT